MVGWSHSFVYCGSHFAQQIIKMIYLELTFRSFLVLVSDRIFWNIGFRWRGIVSICISMIQPNARVIRFYDKTCMPFIIRCRSLSDIFSFVCHNLDPRFLFQPVVLPYLVFWLRSNTHSYISGILFVAHLVLVSIYDHNINTDNLSTLFRPLLIVAIA